MKNMNDVISVDMTVGTLSVLIGGLYTSTTGVSVEAIPSSLYIEIAEVLGDYMPLNIDEFIQGLIIAPKILFSDEELSRDQENNEIFLERKMGNVVLIATAKVVS